MKSQVGEFRTGEREQDRRSTAHSLRGRLEWAGIARERYETSATGE